MVPVRLPPGHTAIQGPLQQLIKPIHLERLCQRRPVAGNRSECLAICSQADRDAANDCGYSPAEGDRS
jgi:hypothetical protein